MSKKRQAPCDQEFNVSPRKNLAKVNSWWNPKSSTYFKKRKNP